MPNESIIATTFAPQLIFFRLQTSQSARPSQLRRPQLRRGRHGCPLPGVRFILTSDGRQTAETTSSDHTDVRYQCCRDRDTSCS